MQCFVHTINLIAKAILRPFDTQRTKDVSDFNNIAQALADSAEGNELEEEEGTEHATADFEKVDIEEEGWKEEFNASLEPIRSMLQKVCLHFLSSWSLSAN
jgi:hypothetical protein